MKSVLLFFVLFPLSSSSQEPIDSTIISKNQAIEIAKKKGFYPNRKNWTTTICYRTKVEDETYVWDETNVRVWLIYSEKDCKIAKHKSKTICINADTGSIISTDVDWRMMRSLPTHYFIE